MFAVNCFVVNHSSFSSCMEWFALQSELSKYLLYTAVVVPCSFTVCMIWQYANIRAVHKQRSNQPGGPLYLESQLRHLISAVHRQRSNQPSDILLRLCLEGQLSQPSSGDHMNNPSNMTFVWGMVAVNIGVFLLWRVPALQPFMVRYFSCCPTKDHSVIASTLSAFSHSNGLHLYANMYMLVGFSSVLKRLGKEQYFALYLGGATVSSLASTLFKSTTGQLVPSLGASGALLSMVAYTCYSLPNVRFSIPQIDKIFPHSFSGTVALLELVVFDCVGILCGWKMFDNAAHLGGTLFGLFYAYCGQKYIWETYRNIIQSR